MDDEEKMRNDDDGFEDFVEAYRGKDIPPDFFRKWNKTVRVLKESPYWDQLKDIKIGKLK